MIPAIYVNLNPTPTALGTQLIGQRGQAAGQHEARYTPQDLAQAFHIVAARFGVEFDGDTEGGLRMPCLYHGGDSEKALHVWLGERVELNRKGEPETIPTLFAKCHSQDCPGPVVPAVPGPRDWHPVGP